MSEDFRHGLKLAFMSLLLILRRLKRESFNEPLKV